MFFFKKHSHWFDIIFTSFSQIRCRPNICCSANSSVDVGIVADGNDSNGVLVPISETDADTEKGPRDTDEELKANNKLYKALDEHGDVHKNNSSGVMFSIIPLMII